MNVIDEFNLSGKIALVAIPEGPYGRSAVLALCEAGAFVYIASDNINAAGKVAEDIKEEGFEVTVFEYDPASEQSIKKLKDKIIEEKGKLDIFVLNSGERFTRGWDKSTGEELYKNLKKNQIGTMLSTSIMGSAIAENNAGSIIFLSSVYALVGPDYHDSMDCTQSEECDFSLDSVFTYGGYINYTRQAASYLGQFNVRVNTICTAPLEISGESAIKFAKRTTLLRNAGENDIKGLVVFLASDASSFLTGASIPLDGGYTAK